jgi:hypothetical protein
MADILSGNLFLIVVRGKFMKIDGITLQQKLFMKPKKEEQIEPEVEQTPQNSTSPSQFEGPPSTEAQPELQEIDSEKGVLRLLQEGHFKGVSDVRLRINFFDELAAFEAAKSQTVTEEKVNNVLESIAGVVSPFIVNGNGLTEEQATKVTELHQVFAETAVEYQNEPVADLTDAFNQFLEALRNLGISPEQIKEENTTPDNENSDTTESSSTTEQPWQTFLENLQSAFTSASDEFTKAINDLQILPELSEPNGNGVAYEKFLAIYNEQRGLNTAADEPVDFAV